MAGLGRVLGHGFALIAELDPSELASAHELEDMGVDALEVVLNYEDTYSFIYSGIWERGFDEIKGTLRIPVGVSVGNERGMLVEDWERLVGTGIDFVDMMAHRMPMSVLLDERVEKVVGIGHGYVLEQVRALSGMKEVTALKASTAMPKSYGSRFTAFDAATLSVIVSSSSKPVLLLTQKLLRPGELGMVMEMGCRGIVVSRMGIDEDSGYPSVLREYRSAIDSIWIRVSRPAPSDT